MQMLSAGGFPCLGSYPAYENMPVYLGWDYWPDCRGSAVKILDAPIQIGTPEDLGECRFVLLTRDPTEQSSSFVKFAKATMGLPDDLKTRRTMADSFRRDLPVLRAALRAHGPVLELRFEHLLTKPMGSILRLEEFVGKKLNRGRMLDQVVKRTARSYPGLLEIELLRDVFRQGEK